MQNKRIRVGILFGGRSAEHTVSIQSATSVIQAIDKKKYEVIPIGISREGRWMVFSDESFINSRDVAVGSGMDVYLPPVPGFGGLHAIGSSSNKVIPIDVFFPLLHGPLGEDGSIQGLFELADVSYVGTGVLGSAVSMDKPTMKVIFAQHGLPITPFRVYDYSIARLEAIREDCLTHLRFPLFVKPSALGSSIGITRVASLDDMESALVTAARYNRRVIVEEAVDKPIEVEVAILGNESPLASVPGEVSPSFSEFYDYESKYSNGKSEIFIPARLPESVAVHVKELALQTFQAVNACGLARVDFLVRRGTFDVYVSEINTLPGFTQFSMYPMLWQASGLSYTSLIDRLIQLAIERHRDR